MTDTIIHTNRTAEIEALAADLRAEITANDIRFARAVARLAGAASVVPVALGFLNIAGVL